MERTRKISRSLVLAVFAWAAFSVTASGSLVLSTPNETSGTGLGAVNTVLTMQSTGGATTESGCVAWNGTATVVGSSACPSGISGGDELAVNETRTLGELGLSSAFNLRVVVNLSEDEGRTITLDEMVLRIFAPDGTVLFSSDPFTAVTLTSVFAGTGTSGFLFRLDTQQAAEANEYFGDPDNRIGLAATASGAEGGHETFYVADAEVVAPPSADLSITKSDSPDPVVVGETLKYTLLVNNAGPNVASDVTVTDNLPSSVTFASTSASQGSCSHTAGTVTCDLGPMAGGSSATVTISVVPTVAGTITNIASVEAPESDPDGGNNNTSEQTEVVPATPPRADLRVSKSDTPDPVATSSTLTYTIVVTNDGPVSATGVTLTDTLPSSVTFVGLVASQGTCSQSGRTVSCDLGTLATAASATVEITVTTGASDAQITNVVTVSANENDPDPANNAASEQTTVGLGAPSRADLRLTKGDAADPIGVGETLTYTLIAGNNGPDQATGVTVTDTLPASVTFGSATTTQGSCTRAGRVVTCDVGALSTASTATITITVTPTAAGVITNTAVVSGYEADGNATNDAASEDTQVTAAVPPRANLSLAKSDSPDPVNVGDTLTYTVVVSNSGPDPATGVVIIDTLPASVTFGGATPSQGSCAIAARILTCTVGSLAVGASANVTITVTPTVAGTIVNNVSVAANEADANTADNAASEATQVGPSPGADLSVLKSDSADPTPVGAPVTYTAVVSNAGPGAATGVQLSDTLPAGVTFGSATPTQGSCAEAGGVVNCTIGTIAAGASVTVTIVVTPAAAGTLLNVATVSGNESDANPANNQDTESTVVIGGPAIPLFDPRVLAVLAALLAGLGAFRLRR